MPFPIYDRKQLMRFFLDTLRNRMKVNPAPGTVWAALAETLADSLLTHSGHTEFIAHQILPTTADGENLARHGRLRGLERKPARRAQGAVDLLIGEP